MEMSDKNRANAKRAELHIHTKMSESVSVIETYESYEAADAFGIGTIAVTDLNSVQSFPSVMKQRWDDNIKVLYGAELCHRSSTGTMPFHLTLLAKNQKGIKALYTVLSAIQKEDGCSFVDWNVIMEQRTHLLCGSAGSDGDLYAAIRDGLCRERIEKIARQYDYLEIYPAPHKDAADETQRINTEIWRLGKEMGIPVVAAGNCHYMHQSDAICRKVVQTVRGQQTGDTQYYLHTTEEMLEEFSYLGNDAAYEAVVENTNRIADSIEQVTPIPKKCDPFALPNAYERFREKCYAAAVGIYGDPLPAIVRERLETELSYIKKYDYASLYLIACELVQHIRKTGYHALTRGSVGSSLAAFLSGMTEINPLKPHYICPQCQYVEFSDDTAVHSGFDLPDRLCPNCGKLMRGDGHHIPFETFMGIDGSKMPDIDLNLPVTMQKEGQRFLCEFFGEDRVAYAGTIRSLFFRGVDEMIAQYEELSGDQSLCEMEREYISKRIQGVKISDGRYPGIIILPEKTEFSDFTPTRNIETSDLPIKRITHFDYHELHDLLLKLDVLGYVVPDILKLAEDFSGHPADEVNYNDPKIYELFAAEHSVNAKNNILKIGTLGLQEFESLFMRSMLQTAPPKCFSDLVQISGLSHGTNTWEENAKILIGDGICTLPETIALRDDIMTRMISHGIPRDTAYQIMEAVRTGKAERTFTPELTELMRDHLIPEWYIDSCRKILYLFPKAHAVSYVMSAVRLAWYKVYYPLEFYAAYLSCRFARNELELHRLCGKTEEIDAYLQEISDSGNYPHDMNAEPILLLVKECIKRGIEFLPPEKGKSHEKYFLPENGNIRLPLFG